MKKFCAALLFVTTIACNNESYTVTPKSDTVIVNLDTIPEIRTNINPKPVVTYHEKDDDALNDWGFDIKVYETQKTFYYLMKVKFEEIDAVDTLKLPNAGIKPVVELHRGNEKYSCIVGFRDKQQQFREYKKVSVQNNQLKIKVLAHYGVYNTLK